MNIFVLDDSDALGRYISKLQPAGSDCKVLCVDPSYYGSKESLDDFFHAILTEDAWRLDGDTQSNENHSLKSLMGNASEDRLFLIHVNLKPTKYSTRQDQEGVELLKHIRLTDKDELGEGRNAHVILYSFEEQLTLLARKPGNLIILSEGVTFLRLPDELNKMATPAELVKLADKLADVDQKDFKRFVQCDFNLPDAAHQFSNWWGVYKLFSSAPVQPQANTPGLAQLLPALLSRCREAMDSLVQEELHMLRNKQALFLFRDDRNSPPCGAPATPIEIPGTKPIILHLDDEPCWLTCMKWFVYSHFTNVDYRSISKVPRRFNKDWVSENICETSPNLILLDLRLHGTEDIDKPVRETSGARLAQMIREQTPGTPIILMTASNKAWVFEEMMERGVDGYWMKEGIGDHLPPEGSIRNYKRLLELISTALGEHYQFLREFAAQIALIKNVPDPWWNKHTWPNSEVTGANTKSVHDLLDGAFVLFRECLRLFCMGYGYTGGNLGIKTSWMSAPIMAMTKVIELVHQLEKDSKRSLATVTWARKDGWGNFLNTQRNLVAHAQGGCIIVDFKHVQSFISGVLTWLHVPANRRLRLLEAQAEYKTIHGSQIFHAIKVVP